MSSNKCIGLVIFAVPKQVDQSFSSFLTERTRVHLFYAYLAEKIICRYSSMQKFKLEYPSFSCTKGWQIVSFLQLTVEFPTMSVSESHFSWLC